MRVEVAELARKLRCLKLPFEYLVRSVWEEVPDADRTAPSLVPFARLTIAGPVL
jgi:hypothetical protein